MKSITKFLILISLILLVPNLCIRSKAKSTVLPASTVVQAPRVLLCSCYAVFAAAQSLALPNQPANVATKCTSLQSKGINLSKYAYEELGYNKQLRLTRTSVGVDTCLAKFSTSPVVLDITWGTSNKQHVVYVVDVTPTQIIARDQQNAQNQMVFKKSTGALLSANSEGFWSTKTAKIDAIRCTN